MSLPYRAHAFGNAWMSEAPLSLFSPVDHAGPSPIAVTLEAGTPPPAARLSNPQHKLQRLPDGLRYTADEVVTIDTHGTHAVHLYPGPAWRGILPFPFFATVTGLLLARRGLLAMHGSTVERHGEATMICGPAGAGKSTLTAGLIAQGARLISDDLTVLHPDAAGGPPLVFAGRTTLRLHPDSARRLGQAVPWTAPPIPQEGKLAVSPPRVGPEEAVPLTRIVLLGEPDEPVKASMLDQHFFRPHWIRTVPGDALRRASLAIAARRIDLRRQAAIDPGQIEAAFTRSL